MLPDGSDLAGFVLAHELGHFLGLVQRSADGTPDQLRVFFLEGYSGLKGDPHDFDY
jgi:hypothetical protein